MNLDDQFAELAENGRKLKARIAAQSAQIDKLIEVRTSYAQNIAALLRNALLRERGIEGSQE